MVYDSALGQYDAQYILGRLFVVLQRMYNRIGHAMVLTWVGRVVP